MADNEMSLPNALNALKTFTRTFAGVQALDAAGTAVMGEYNQLEKLRTQRAELEQAITSLTTKRDGLTKEVETATSKKREMDLALLSTADRAKEEQQAARVELDAIKRDTVLARNELTEARKAHEQGMNAMRAELAEQKRQLEDWHKNLAAQHSS